ncbi:hypothetical protein CANMA_001988 [Candida margitis]|uniref:uncharacterized protein n=1 Tax=Candida margitis TaxID=1775924 RepID=UPI002226F6AA|nr:uncharacterized protein CANMA_001988 [Candida margitis]KAI5968992.1 hypothetical protein CANMA_001988 [Candida margitis]
MDPTPDIFEELDTALMEIFHRNHHRDLNNLSEQERQRAFDEMADLIRQNSLNSASNRRRTVRRFYEITWYWNYIPYIVLRFDRIGQQITLANFKWAVTHAIFYFVKTIQAGFRITHKWDIFYYLNLEEFQNASILQHTWLIFKNYRASLLNTICIVAREGPSDCDLITNSLVFRMSDAISETCPQLSTNMVRFITVTTYLLYATLGNFICLNVLFFLSYNIMRRIAGYSKIVKNLGSVVGSTFVKYIA